MDKEPSAAWPGPGCGDDTLPIPNGKELGSAALEARSAIRAAIAGLGVAYGMESSTKLCGGKSIADRKLFSVPIAALGVDPRAGLARFFEELSAPQEVAASMTPYIGAAEYLHAGAEEGGSDDVRKVYLEFTTPPPRDSDLVFVAAKWSASNRWMRSFYRQRSQKDLEELMASVAPKVAIAPLAALMDMARTRNAVPSALEVHDEGTLRRSLDLNFYDAQIALAEAADEVMALFEKLGPGPAEGAKFVQAHKVKLVGHVAVGCGRDGLDFATIHFGAEPGS